LQRWRRKSPAICNQKRVFQKSGPQNVRHFSLQGPEISKIRNACPPFRPYKKHMKTTCTKSNKNIGSPDCPPQAAQKARLIAHAILAKQIVIGLMVLGVSGTAWSQSYYVQVWVGSNSSWQGSANWDNFPQYSAIGFGFQRWDGNGNITTQTNNNGGNTFATHRWSFYQSQNKTLTFNGDPVRFYDISGDDPGIENYSPFTHTINMNISGDGTPEDDLQIYINNDSGGGLTFNGAVNNEGSHINILGSAASSATVRFNGVVSGSGGIHKENANILLLFDAANTQTGQLTVQSGTARLNGAGDTFGASSQDIRIHSGGVLDLNNVSTTVGSVAEEGFENSGIVALGSGTLTIAGANKGTFYQNTISGSGGLTMAGSGNTTMVLFGNQTYTGPTTVTSGSLGTLGSMSSTQYTVAGGNFSTDTYNNLLPSSANITLSSGTIKLGGSETVRTISSTGGTFDMNGKNLTANSSASTTFAGTLAGGNSTFAKQGSGTLTLTANNSYTGGTYIDGGTLALSGTGSLAQSQSVKVGAGAVLDIGGVSSSATVQTISEVGFQNGGEVHLGSKTLNVVGANKGTFYQNTISGSGGLTMAGSGNTTMILYGNQTYTGATTITGGTLQIGLVLDESTVAFSSPSISNNSALNLAHNGIQNLSADMGGSGTLAKFGNGTTTISGNFAHTGTTTISGGTLALAGNGSLSQSGFIRIGSGAALDISGVSSPATVQAVSEEGFSDGGGVHLGSNTLIVAGANKGTFFQNTISGSGGLTMAGSGNTTMVLYGNATYTGATTITGGTLSVTGSLNNSTATVQSGATLSGSGSVGGLILNSGATLSPGNSPGTFSTLGNATWNGGANLNWQVLTANTDPNVQTAAGTGWDFFDVSGTLTLGLSTSNKFNINLWSLSSTGPDVNGTIAGWDPAVGSTWLIATADGGINLNGTGLSSNTDYSSYFTINTAATNGAGGWYGGLPASFQILTLGNANSLYLQSVTIGASAVPEPGQIAASLLLAAGTGIYFAAKRIRRRKMKLNLGLSQTP
jgi:fibronectin-binding autotransporter adhesin